MSRPHTTSVAAFVGGGTHVVVVAVGRIVRKNAAGLRHTRIIGTTVVVVADHRGPRNTVAPFAGVTCRASIAIVAGERVGGIQAARRGVTTIVGARIAIPAVNGGPTLALSAAAFVARRAQIAIVATECIELIRTPHRRATRVVGTRVVVVAIQR